MLLLRNVIQPSAWGPIDGLVPLVGCDRSGDHQAELWVGTHERGPSVVVGGGHDGRTLAEVIAEDPRTYLGAALADAGATELPFLLKVLAIGEALSIQAHPSAAQAEAGFEREEAAGIAIDAPDRTYRDRSSKPEALVALLQTWALCGFRPPFAAAELVERLGLEVLDPLASILRENGPEALHDALGWVLRLEGDERAQVASSVAAGAAEATSGRTDRADPCWWVARLAVDHPGDPTCLAPLLMELLSLAPGEAVHLPAGNLHAYLQGAGVEVMAASDNVLRGGLTEKHVDIDGLLGILHFEPGVPPRPETGHEVPSTVVYDCGEPAFLLTRIDPTDGPVMLEPAGPSLLLAVDGEVELAGIGDRLTVGHGEAAFVAPGEGPLLATGSGTLWWATVGASPD